jgi:hypothetical protein
MNREWLNQHSKKETRMMRILALDLGKYKTVACDYEAESGRHRFATVLTTPKALHDLIVDRAPQRVVIEICSIAGWVGDLVRSLGIELQVANTSDETLALAKNQTEERSARCFEGSAALGRESTVPGACAGADDAPVAGLDCLSLQAGAAAHESKEPHS